MVDANMIVAPKKKKNGKNRQILSRFTKFNPK